MAYSPTYTRDRRGKWPAEQNTGITQVVAGSDAYIMEDEFNLMQQMLNEARADIVRKAVNSGVTDFSSIAAYGSVATLNGFNYKNETAYINGYKIPISAWNTALSGVTDNNRIILDPPPVSNVIPSLPGSAGDALAFTEAWFQEVSSASGSADTSLYNYGGVASGTVANDILDTRVNAETTRRVQLRWRLRTVSGVDFATYPTDGFVSQESTSNAFMAWNASPRPSNNQLIAPQGGNLAPLTLPTTQTVADDFGYLFQSAAQRSSASGNGAAAANTAVGDTGVYVAGLGNATWKTRLNTVDGYVYAIPLFRVRRRNNTGFDPDTNPLGARDYYTVSANYPVVASGNSYTITLTSGTTSSVQVGDILGGGSNVPYFQVTAVPSSTTLTVTALQSNSTNYSSITYNNFSVRPDGLYSNVIDASDITDLRHQVSLTGFNMQALLEKNLDLLLRGQLTTNAPARYGRDYIGVNTSAYTDDVNSLLFLKFDGSMAGTANSVNVTNTKIGAGAEVYKNGVQGQGADFSANNYGEQYAVNVPATGWSIEGFFKQNWTGNPTNEVDLVNGYSGAPSTANRTSTVLIGVNGFIGDVWDATGGQHTTAPISMANTKAGDTHYFKVTYDGTTIKAQLDEQTVSFAYTGGVASSYVQVGYNGPLAGFGVNGTVDLLRVSNIVRTGTPLPTGFSYANGDRILDGPNADFTTWSDDVGGTAGLLGRTNPYGLSRVPNQLTASVAYNGSEVRHYYGQGTTVGWAANIYGGGSSPTGSFDSSAEVIYISSNEAANGSITTFTFTKPTNAQGVSLLFNAPTISVYVNGAYTAANSMAYNPSTGLITVIFPSAPANSSVVQLYYDTGSRHAHFISSTKGFVLHDWTDGSIAANGSATLFQTTKYNVTAINHVRTSATATPNTQTIAASGTTYQGIGCATTLTANAANAATTLTVGSSTNMFVGQSLRIAKGDGTWYSTTVSTIVNATSITVPATTGALTSGATIQGTAQVTFGVAPAAGTVDIVYESVLTPSLGDYLRVMYQATPYQGVIAPNDSYTILAESNALVTSLGTGAVHTGVYSGTVLLAACTVNLPTPTNDYILKNDAFAGNTRPSVPTKQMMQSTWDDVPSGNSYTPKRVGTTTAMSGTLGACVRGVVSGAVTYATSTTGTAYLYAEQISVSVPIKTILVQLVKDQNGLLRLIVYVNQQTTNQPNLMINGAASTAVDSFHIQGRPLIKGYAGVTN